MRIFLSFLFALSLMPGAHVFANDQAPIEFLDAEMYGTADSEIEKLPDDPDLLYEFLTGESPLLSFNPERVTDCYRSSCKVWAEVIKSSQTLNLYIDGNLEMSWLVSTGKPGSETPKFDRHPTGPIYDKYSSKSYPGGDYMGLGNMPYAVFIKGGYATHGTPEDNWKNLGKKASHGCIRSHPDNGKLFNRLVREHGIHQTWITVK